MSYDLTDLRLFAAIVDAGSITAGAARAGLALASASARVIGMEEALGAPLLERLPRGVRPTPAGHALAHHARLVLEQMERLRGDLRAHARGGLRGHIRLLSNTAALEEHLPDALAGWLAANPGVSIDLSEHESRAVAQGVAAGRGDLGVLADFADIEGLQTFTFRVDRLWAVLPPGHRLGATAAVAFADLLAEDFVASPADSAIGEHLAARAARLGMAFAPRLRLRGFDAICRMVGHGVGVAVVPETAARRAASAFGVAARPLADAWAVRTLAICVRDVAALPAHARSLVAHLAAAADHSTRSQ